MAQVRDKMLRMKKDPSRIGHNLYCSKKCYYDAKASVAEAKVNHCCECGVVVTLRKEVEHRTRCGDCHAGKLCQHFTIDEVLYLARLNPSVGIRYFIENLYLGKQPGDMSRAAHKFMSFFKMIEEEEGVNYYEWLQSRKYLVKMRQDDVPSEKNKFTRGERRSVPSGHLRRKRMREGLTDGERQKYVYVPPDFKWGELEDLKDKFSKMNKQ
jgi:hypothetical protein